MTKYSPFSGTITELFPISSSAPSLSSNRKPPVESWITLTPKTSATWRLSPSFNSIGSPAFITRMAFGEPDSIFTTSATGTNFSVGICRICHTKYTPIKTIIIAAIRIHHKYNRFLRFTKTGVIRFHTRSCVRSNRRHFPTAATRISTRSIFRNCPICSGEASNHFISAIRSSLERSPRTYRSAHSSNSFHVSIIPHLLYIENKKENRVNQKKFFFTENNQNLVYMILNTRKNSYKIASAQHQSDNISP